MKYPPTFAGFLKAVFDTFVMGKRLKPQIPEDEPGWNIDDYEIYEPGKDPGMEFWRAEAEKLAERKEHDKAEAEKVMIRNYELEHAEVKTEESGNEEVAADGTDDFHADIGIDFDSDFDDES